MEGRDLKHSRDASAGSAIQKCRLRRKVKEKKKRRKWSVPTRGGRGRGAEGEVYRLRTEATGGLPAVPHLSEDSNKAGKPDSAGPAENCAASGRQLGRDAPVLAGGGSGRGNAQFGSYHSGRNGGRAKSGSGQLTPGEEVRVRSIYKALSRNSSAQVGWSTLPNQPLPSLLTLPSGLPVPVPTQTQILTLTHLPSP